jgi:ABC-type lipoprotein release transport system permease subunit
MGADVSEVSFVVASDAALASVIPSLRAVAARLDIQDWATITPFAFAMVRVATENVFVVFVVMFALMSIGIINAQLMAVFERTREFGLLQALGMRAHLIVLQVAVESALLVAIGVTAGGILSMLTLALFSNGLDLGTLSSGAERLGAGRILHLSLAAPRALVMCALVWSLGTAAALWPAWRAARADPIEAMSSH